MREYISSTYLESPGCVRPSYLESCQVRRPLTGFPSSRSEERNGGQMDPLNDYFH
jgi:hypothetical protein